jgi:hypothetical protein
MREIGGRAPFSASDLAPIMGCATSLSDVPSAAA